MRDAEIIAGAADAIRIHGYTRYKRFSGLTLYRAFEYAVTGDIYGTHNYRQQHRIRQAIRWVDLAVWRRFGIKDGAISFARSTNAKAVFSILEEAEEYAATEWFPFPLDIFSHHDPRTWRRALEPCYRRGKRP